VQTAALVAVDTKGGSMRLLIALLAVAFLTVATSALAGDGHVKAALEPVDGSGLSGFVQLQQLPEGSNVHVVVRGLAPTTRNARKTLTWSGRSLPTAGARAP